MSAQLISNSIKPSSKIARDCQPGDIATWNILGSVTHICIVVNLRSGDKACYLISYNMAVANKLPIGYLPTKSLVIMYMKGNKNIIFAAQNIN